MSKEYVILDAAEACDLSISNAPNMSRIMNLIEKEASKGLYTLTLSRELPKDYVEFEPQLSEQEYQYLLWLGYKIEVISSETTVITWGHQKYITP